MTRLQENIQTLEKAGCSALHFDIMDGTFVPDFGLGPEAIAAVRRCSDLPCEAHLMVQDPGPHVDRFIEAGCAVISIHVESALHAHRILNRIRDRGASPCIAINPATPLTKLEYLLDSVDRILLMTAEWGTHAGMLPHTAIERLRILKQNIAYRKLGATIQVEGCVTEKNASLLSDEGAAMAVLDEKSLFETDTMVESLAAFNRSLTNGRPSA